MQFSLIPFTTCKPWNQDKLKIALCPDIQKFCLKILVLYLYDGSYTVEAA